MTKKNPRQIGIKLAKAGIMLYQKAISPLFPPSCRYYPTCSSYALQAIEQFGIIKGGYLALIRIFSCHPGFRGGVDFVPAEWPGWKGIIIDRLKKRTFGRQSKKGSG